MPVVVGAGCAGLFCALTLAKAGLNPLLIERGDDAARRTAAVEHHNQTGQLDLESNIQFGLGGAGTFSDGKLRSAELLYHEDKTVELIRRAETMADYFATFDYPGSPFSDLANAERTQTSCANCHKFI